MSRNRTVNSDSHLEVVLRWSDQHHPDCLRYGYSSVLGSVCSHILEVKSQNCGSLCHSYSLGIITFNFYRIEVSVCMLTDRIGSEYCLKPLRRN